MAIIQELESYVQSYPAGMDTVTDVSLSQNENGRQLRFKIIGVTIPAGSIASISGTKPDGVVYSKAGTIEGSDTVIFDEDVQMTAVFGTWYAKIRIINSGNTIASARVRFIIDKDPVDAGSVPSDSQLDGIIAEMEAYVEEARSVAYGSPLTASTAAAMTDQTKVYVYTGTETGYTAGHWYFWNGTEWHDGGVYNAVAVQTDKTLSVADKAADGKATGEALEHRIPVYSEDSYTSDSTPYLYRTTGGGVAVGTRELDEVVGGSVGWNQLCNGSSVTVQNGHKYYMVKGGTASIGASTGSAITGLTSGTDMVIDLTLLLGSTIADYIYSLETATAGSGIEKLKEWGFFTEDYYAYDAGSLQSVTGVSAHEMVGKNLLNLNNETPDSSEHVRAYYLNGFEQLNPIFQISGTVRSTAGSGAQCAVLLIYDDGSTSGTKYFTNGIQGSFAYDLTGLNKKTAEVRFYSSTNYSASQNYTLTDIQVQIEYGNTATEYEPYTKHTYPLDSSLTLRGIPKLSNDKLYYDGDVYASDGTVTRKYGVVHMKDLTWAYTTEDGVGRFYATLSDIASKGNGKAWGGNIVCPKYVTLLGDNDVTYWPMISALQNADKCILEYTSGGGAKSIAVKDTSYSDATTFKNSLNGIYMAYELATPTTETADPYASVQICAEGGTEEYVTTGIVPVGHNTKYPADLAGKLDSIPALPTTAGNYRLKVTVTGGVPSYEWVSA